VIDGERRAVLDTGNPVLRGAWSQRFAAHVGLLQGNCRRYQAHLVSLRTDQPVGETLSEGLRPRVARAGGIR
jgi:hypothetical protein